MLDDMPIEDSIVFYTRLSDGLIYEGIYNDSCFVTDNYCVHKSAVVKWIYKESGAKPIL